MRFSTVVWITLVFVGLFGAFSFSAIYFGLFTIGLFLLFYNRGTEGKKPQLTTQPTQFMSLSTSVGAATHTCQNCGMVLEAGTAFCPRCGTEVNKR